MMVIVIDNGHNDPSSNPGQGFFFISHSISREGIYSTIFRSSWIGLSNILIEFLQKSKPPTQCSSCDTKPSQRLQFGALGDVEYLLYCHYSQVHSDSLIVPVRVPSTGQIVLASWVWHWTASDGEGPVLEFPKLGINNLLGFSCHKTQPIIILLQAL